MENKITQNQNKNIKKSAKKLQKAKLSKQKEQYFAFYDDIKKGSGKQIYW